MASSLPTEVDICIVGAGPSGLAAALGLAARNIPFIIVDALEEGHNGSRAIGMHANALEALNKIRPELVPDILARGIVSDTITVLDGKGEALLRTRLGAALAGHTEFPYWVTIQQHRVEAPMRAHLQRMGTNIHWRKRVSSIRPIDDDARYELQFESGERLAAKYIIAADGVNSSIRNGAGIRYLDPHTNEEAIAAGNAHWDSFVVADVAFDPHPSTIPTDRAQLTVGRGAMVLSAPVRIQGADGKEDIRTRLYLGVAGTAPPPRIPDRAYLQALVDAHGPPSERAKISQVLDSARYRSAVALAESYVARAAARPDGDSAYVLLVGDAAHRHGPAGGQGMNLGICDGAELAEVLASALAKTSTAQSHSDLFTAYSNRRRAIAQKVIAMVEDMTALEMSGPGWGDYFRMLFVWAACKVPLVERTMAWKMSGLVYTRKT